MLVVWTQWSSLDVPEGVQAYSEPGLLADPGFLERVHVYVPLYMGGPASLEPVRSMPSLRLIQVTMAGYDQVLPLLPPGVTLCNAAGVHNDATAELAVGLAISSLRGLAGFRDAQREHRWAARRDRSLTDSNVAVVGYGDVGRRLGGMLDGFDLSMTAFSRSGSHGARTIDELADALGEFDVVFLTVPLTDETRGMVDAKFLARMKTGALLVNVSRGQVVDTDALLAELESGRLCAALDVTDPEPLPSGHRLWDAPNCIISPHVGGAAAASFEARMHRLIRSQLERLLDGRPLDHVVA